MHDCSDWPVSFLGAMYAGIVPVAVNTLLTADDYAFMLRTAAPRPHWSRARCCRRCKPRWNRSARGQDGHRLAARRRPAAGRGRARHVHRSPAPLAEPAATGPDDPGFWLYSSGSTGRPKGTVHTHANPYWTAELYGKAVLGVTERDICFSAAKLFFAYGLGNALTFPLSVGATTILMAERPTPDAVFKRWTRAQADAVLRRTDRLCRHAGRAQPAGQRSDVALRLASSAGEALPAELGERFTAHFGVDIVDGIGSTEMLHIFLSNLPGECATAPPAGRCRATRSSCAATTASPVADGETGDLYISGPSAALMYWGNRDKSRETFQGAWTKSGDKYVRNADGTYTYAGRSDDMLKVSGIYVSPFEVEATLVQHPGVLEAAVIGVADAEGLTRAKAFVVLKPDAGHRGRAQGLREGPARAVQVPARDRVRDELPKTATGKIQRFKLRELEGRREPAASPEPGPLPRGWPLGGHARRRGEGIRRWST